ncbi:hypothetical protein [Bacteriovorax sp. Seq25_V]|uniref:hypothetical protein n=1 Tax=Bacteriovorax sp. Seq25_V TaxID=1201288 RepID=UPI00038A1D6B|nr:hypothetical protein [Bacteriovorax sp. Seq25_V]EQC43584.1 hypothetical protein M900_2799 [Bacteriovorax sp. Seq25_V]
MKFTLACLLTTFTFAKTLNFETARTKSTAGAGVASILMNEATVTNPAPLAFFNLSSIYFEKFSSTITNDDNSSELDNYAFIASDSSKNLKGSVAYIKSSSDGLKNKQFNVAFAATTGKKSAAGITYKDVKKQYRFQNQVITKNYKQFVPGVFHVVNQDFSLGFVAIDPLRKNPQESKVILGAQYTVLNYITLMLDVGADYKEDLNSKSLIRSAAQVRIFNDFFFRVGAYEDKGLKERGNGIGIGWVQPKLVIDLALKNTKVSESLELQQDKEEIKETSFSLSYRF